MASKYFQQILEESPAESKIFVKKYLDIVDRIHELLEKKGLKQKDLAQRLGKQESEISKWLNGEHNLTLRTIAKMEAILEDDIISIPNSVDSFLEEPILKGR